jgi:hypothetical protein
LTSFQTAEYDAFLGSPRQTPAILVSEPEIVIMVSIRINGPAAAGLLLGLLGSVSPAWSQTPGTRAAGMAEAFVAVADDATSVFWNPAGMATGAYLSFVVDYGDGRGPGGDEEPGRGASEGSTRFIGFTVPPLGVAYYRRSRVVADPASPAGMAGQSREDGGRRVRGLTTSNIGVTVAQSLTDVLVAAATVRLVRGEVSSGFVAARDGGAALEAAAALPSRRATRVDVDGGVMLAVDRWRAGLVARNLTTPSFDGPEPDGVSVDLDREVRAGAAWGSGWPGISRVVVSADVDLTRHGGLTGDRRDVAAGAETWWLGQRLGVRGGVRASTRGEARPVVAAGVSAALRPGAYAEAHVARGTRDERSWSVGARLTF